MELWIRASILTVMIVISTLFFLQIKKKHDILSYNVFIAFMISFFGEMYGFVFTFLLVDTQIHRNYVQLVGKYIGDTLLVIGIVIVAIGWYQIHNGKGKLVNTGLYKYSRHPQYLGLIIFCIGWQVQYPLLLSLCVCILLVVIYYFLSRFEEKQLISKFGNQYLKYKNQVRMFL